MKKLLALFMMCWLPLFMSSAWSMDLQMQTQMPQQHESMNAMADMPCHMEMSETHADTVCDNCPSSGSDAHNCASCGLCMISLTATQIESPVTTFNVTPSNAISLPDVAFFSLDYPPALKPPIHS